MGGQSTQQTQQSTTGTSNSTSTPGFGTATAPTVSSILGALNPLIGNSGLTSPQQTSINQLTQLGQAGNPYATGAENTNANTLLSGGGATSQNPYLVSNYQNLGSNIGAMANPNYSTLNSPAVAQALATANQDVTDQVNGAFAKAGRSGSGYNNETLARGITAADAPIILNQANTDTANQLNAANMLYGAGNTTSGAVTGNDQTSLSNMLAGTGAVTSATNQAAAGPTAAIQAQQLGQSIPASNLGLLANIGIPLASLNNTNNVVGNTSGTGTSDTTSNMSAVQQLAMVLGGVGSLIPKGNGNTFNF